MSLANCSVPIAWPRTFDHASIHWSMNCFHCGRSSGVAGVWAKSFAQVSSPWSNTGRQNAVGSGGAMVGARCERRRVQAWVDSSTCLRHISKRSEEHTSELQSPCNLVCRLLLEKKKNTQHHTQSCQVAH